MEISMLCPTRERPAGMERTWETALSTASDKSCLEIVYYLDHDDKPSQEKGAELAEKYGNQVKIIHGPTIVLSKMWNVCCEAATADILFCAADDLAFRTEGWDKLVLSAYGEFPDKIAMVYGRDGIHDARLATHPFLHRNWVQALGYFFPPYFESGYNDTWTTDVAIRIRRAVYIDKLYIEHMHAAVGKAQWDGLYRRRVNLAGKNRVLYDQLAPKRQADAEKLKAYIEQHS